METPTFVFDGDCAFCSACAQFIDRWIPTDARVVPWQRTDLAALRLTRAECEAAVQWVDGARTLAGPAAIAALLRSSRGAWRPLGWILARRALIALGWPVYRLISRNRHRLPGGTPACALPAAQRSTAPPPGEADPPPAPPPALRRDGRPPATNRYAIP